MKNYLYTWLWNFEAIVEIIFFNISDSVVFVEQYSEAGR